MKNIKAIDSTALMHEMVVVAFDMCSSSKILEDLTRTDSLSCYDRLLKNLQLWLAANTETFGFVLYKFTGDGWILLFPTARIDGNRLMKFLVQLCKKHQKYRREFVDSNLEAMPESVGLTLGIDTGRVRRVTFVTSEIEFVGRPINVACRLQFAVKDKTPGPDYRCLMSRKVYNQFMKPVTGFIFGPAERTLRNINGGEKYQCYKIDLTDVMNKDS
jgi:class 3 adenylate cyclase